VANRSPIETLASMCKLVRCFRQAYGRPDADNALIIEANYKGMEAHLANRREYPDLPILDLRFEDIVGSLPATLQRVYGHARMTPTLAARARMLAWSSENTMHKLGEFRYSLADTGLDEAVIRRRMAGYFAHLDGLGVHADP
jgi:hypothetical protein